MKLNERQRQLLSSIRDATDGTHCFQRSGAANIRGLVARGPTIRALESRGLVAHGGYCDEVDGDGYTVREDAPWYFITNQGREVLR